MIDKKELEKTVFNNGYIDSCKALLVSIPTSELKVYQALAQSYLKGELVKPELYHIGGEDDGYGGKTQPITYKEAYEEELRYDKDMRKELMKAMEEIRASKGYPQNQYPSPCDRAWKAAGTRIIKELEARVAKKEPELTRGELVKIIEKFYGKCQHDDCSGKCADLILARRGR